MTIVTGTSPRAGRDVRDRPWFPALAVVALVAVLGVVIVRVVRHDVVTDWRVLATCAAPGDTVVRSVAATPDTSVCAVEPADKVDGRGWPVVAALLPASAGDSPEVRRVRADTAARTVVIDYRVSGAPSTTAHVVYVEVPPTAVPDTPVTVTSSPQP